MASEEVRGSFCRYDSCVITDQLATGVGALERELLTGRLVERLTPLQEKILTLLKVPQELYNLSFSEPMVNLDTEFSAAA
jgi:hypothetical protein